MPSILTTRSSTLRTVIPHPPGQRVQTELLWLYSPSGGTGVHGQFCDHIDESSISFQGIGVIAEPAAPPITNDKKLLLPIFIDSTP